MGPSPPPANTEEAGSPAKPSRGPNPGLGPRLGLGFDLGFNLGPGLKVDLGLVPVWLGLLWIGWPLLWGQMPLSADHTVHLARSTALCELLSQAKIRGWSEMWAFGLPLGELYPPLGDYLHCGLWGLRQAIPGLDPGPQGAYAWLFFIVLSLQAISAYLLGRSVAKPLLNRPGQVLSGILAAFFITWDVGYYREGGWIYSVTFGVWPQALATALSWIALTRARAWLEEGRPSLQIGVQSALWMAAALLAHPIALPQLFLCGTLMLGAMLAQPQTRAYGHQLFLVAGLAFALAAFWWLPMLEHREFMANYGWLHRSSSSLLRMLARGEFSQWMIPSVGFAALVGIGISLTSSHAWPRVVAAAALVLWGLSSRDVFWDLRLDRLSSAFTHLQYQRFLIGAKPAMFALAAMSIALGLSFVFRSLSRLDQIRAVFDAQKAIHKALPLLNICFSLALLCAFGYQLLQDLEPTQKRAEKWSLGRFQLDRFPQNPSRDEHYRQLVAWAQTQQDTHGAQRFWFVASRNQHWFMDFSALTGHPIYKSGFTPGDNFRHRPESSAPAILEALGVDYRVQIRKSSRAPLGYAEIQRFGDLVVYQRLPSPAGDRSHNKTRIRAWNDAGEEQSSRVSLLARRPSEWEVQIDASAQALTIQLPVAHYARWVVQHEGQSLKTFATPILQPTTKPKLRRDPERALGNDGKSPTLLSFRAPTSGLYRISYQTWSSRDRIAAVISILAFLLVLLLGLENRLGRSAKIRILPAPLSTLLRSPMPPRLNALLFLLAFLLLSGWGGSKLRSSMQAERQSFMQWAADHPPPEQIRCRLGPFKANMKIRPAMIARPKAQKPAHCHIFGYPMPDALTMWFAVEDDDAKRKIPGRPRHNIRVQARAAGSDDEYQVLSERSFAHRPDRHFIDFMQHPLAGSKVDLRISVESEAPRGAWIGFNATPLEAGP